MTRRVMKEFRIDEVSAVDSPAQKPARAVLLKRGKNPAPKDEREDTMEEVRGHENDPTGDDSMTPEEKAALEQKVTKAEQRAERAEKILALPADQRAVFAKFTDAAAQDAYLAKAPAERAAEIAKANEADAVVFEDKDTGTVYRKSDDPRLVALAKRAAEDRAALVAERTTRANEALAKRAEVELKHLPGDAVAKVELLRAIDAVPAAHRTAVQEILKASDAGLAKAFERAGTTGGAPDAASPLGQLETLVKAEQEKSKTTYAKAYTAVLSTPQGAALYAKHSEAAAAVRS